VLLGVLCLFATVIAMTKVLKKDTGLLGINRSAVETKLGRAAMVDVNIKPAVAFYCVTGTYQPIVYDHDGHWFHGPQRALGGYSAGPCGDHAENLAVMYDANDRVIAAGYLTVHAHTYDRGWGDFLDRLILGRGVVESYKGATNVDIPGITVKDGPYAQQLTTGETSVVFDSGGRMALVLFADKNDATNEWFKLINDDGLWVWGTAK
jgi:hypothetical protein